jgi:hypothetical protein
MFAAANNHRIFHPHSLPKAQFSSEISGVQTGRIQAAKTGINDVVRVAVLHLGLTPPFAAAIYRN